MRISSPRFAARPRFFLPALLCLFSLIAYAPAAKAKRPVPAAEKTVAGWNAAPVDLRIEREDGWTVWRSAGTGLVRRAAPGRGSAPVPAKGTSPRAAARLHLDEARSALGLDPVWHELEPVLVKRGLASTHVLFARVLGGVTVEPDRVGVHMDGEGRLLFVDGTLDPRLSAPADAGKAAALSRDEAVRIAVSAPEGSRAAPRADLLYREWEGALRLHWRVRYIATDPIAEWEVWIDGTTGEVRERIDRTARVTGTGTIWSPNPVNALGRTDLYDMDDADQALFTGAYETVPLLDLDPPVGGMYRLSGPYVTIDDFEPDFPGDGETWIPEAVHPDSFQTTRSDQVFEAVMAYYHIDKVQRYVRSLGFDGVAADSLVASPIAVDPHGLSGDDNSHYLNLTNQLAYGDGCVDDAEEADVIVHEYGHAIEYSQVPNWGYPGGFMGPMAEGFSDYWAESHAARSDVVADLGQVFDWDLGPMDGCWAGRRVDNDKTMADLYEASGVPIPRYYYDNSLIWSGTLWEIHQTIGGAAADSVILESHFHLNGTSPNSTFEDAAFGMLQADRALTGWRNGLAIYDVLAGRGILDESDTPQPALVSAATTDTLFGGGTLRCTLEVDTDVPLRSVRVIYGDVEAAGDTAALAEETAASGTWIGAADLLGAESFFYFYRTEDAAGRVKTLPAGAPANSYKVVVGVDGVPPVITHTPLDDLVDSELPATLTARITDNFGVDPEEVFVRYSSGAGPSAVLDSFPLVYGEADSFWTGDLPIEPDETGDYSYAIVAADLSAAANRTVDPPAGMHQFRLSPDEEAPAVTHTPLADREEGGEAPPVRARITDDGALDPDSLLMEYLFTGLRRTDAGSVVMGAEGNGSYAASFPAFPESVGTVEYRIRAVDRAVAKNGVFEPAAGYHRFEIYPASALLTVLGPVPFRDRIDFTLQLAGEEEVLFEIYDVAGRRVRTVRDGLLGRGAHLLTWDGRNGADRDAAPGIYLYRLEAAGFEKTGRIVRIR